MVEIYEDKLEQKQPNKTLLQLNTPEQSRKGDFYSQKYILLSSEMDERTTKWNELERHYKCDRDIIENCPNSFVPVTAPNINGQIASMIDQNISATVKGKGYADDQVSHIGQMVALAIIKENRLKQKVKVGIKRYLLFGTGCIAMDYDPDMLDGFGMPILRFPQITNVYVDGNIKDISDYQRAEYIIEEIGFQSILWARAEFGDDIADYIATNNNTSVPGADVSSDEMYSFKYLKVWHRNNKYHNLQLFEMDGNGFCLRESEPETPYYEYVNNRYPFVFFGLYQEEGNFYRFGDGQLLKFVQDTINKLYDAIVTACKSSAQATTYVDPTAQFNEDDHDGDPSHVEYLRDPNTNIKSVQGQGVNQVVFDTLRDLMQQAAKITRFDPIMSGIAPQREITATQAGFQAQQGNIGISDKKSDISFALSDAVSYCMGMTMELWTSGRLMKVTDDPDAENVWVDAKRLKSVPIMLPASEDYLRQWKTEFPDTPDSLMPRFYQYEPDKDITNDAGDVIAKAGEGQLKIAELDLFVSIGEGLPTNKLALYNILLSLSQMKLVDEKTGQLKPLLGYAQARKMIEETLGIHLDETMSEINPAMSGGAGRSIGPQAVPQIPVMNRQNGGMVA